MAAGTTGHRMLHSLDILLAERHMMTTKWNGLMPDRPLSPAALIPGVTFVGRGGAELVCIGRDASAEPGSFSGVLMPLSRSLRRRVGSEVDIMDWDADGGRPPPGSRSIEVEFEMLRRAGCRAPARDSEGSLDVQLRMNHGVRPTTQRPATSRFECRERWQKKTGTDEAGAAVETAAGEVLWTNGAAGPISREPCLTSRRMVCCHAKT